MQGWELRHERRRGDVHVFGLRRVVLLRAWQLLRHGFWRCEWAPVRWRLLVCRRYGGTCAEVRARGGRWLWWL